MRLFGLLLLAFLLLAACGDEGTVVPEGTPSSPERRSPTPMVSKPTGETPEGQPPIDGPVEDTRTGAVPVSDAGGCTANYSAAAVASRAFAFDGTITEIGDGGVTFDVQEWFVGEGPESYTVQMHPPTKSGMSESPPSYFVGTRLLVSGEQDGAPIAWSCGFTRYFDEETAVAWRS
ncbi:MAG: hypothetical protein WKF50_03770 [Nocardioides sp.]